MTRWLALAIVAVMLAVPLASSASWTQTGFDAARTGNTPDPGPAWNDTAFTVQLPGAARGTFIGTGTEPLIVDGSAYVAVRPTSADDGLEAQGVARVDLHTAQVDLLVEMDAAPETMAIHDEMLYVTREDGVDAFELDTGETVWSEDTPQQTANPWMTLCFTPAVLEGTLLVPCTEFEGPEGGPPTRTVPFLIGFDLETGELQSLRVLDREREARADDERDLQDTSASHLRFVIGVSAIDRYVVATTLDIVDGSESEQFDGAWVSGSVDEFRLMVWAFDGVGGETLWTDTTEPQRRIQAGAWVEGVISESYEEGDRREPVAARVTGTAREIYTKLNGTVSAFNPAQGTHLWSEPLGSRDARSAEGGMNSALSGTSLYVASTQSLYRFDVSEPVRDWSFSVNPSVGEQFTWGSLIAANGTVYGMTNDWSAGGALYAVDAETGTLAWRKGFAPAGDANSALFAYALGDGAIVVAGSDGSLHVVGETEASPTPSVEISDPMPAPGEPVRVELGDSDAGAFGPVTRYKADWGDGTTTGWMSNSTLTHVYKEAGTHEARFVVANDENQSASTMQTFDVGAVEPNWLSERFEPENQEMTFGVLGIALALGGGAIGVARRHRKRSNLEQELDALERGFEEARETPSECEALLDNRKARARSLALDGKLKEDQVGIIENRAEELRGNLRVSMLDDRFAFLPHGMVRTLERMLEDGRINAWERETFLAALEEQEMLTEEQKGKVERLIGQWLDEGGMER